MMMEQTPKEIEEIRSKYVREVLYRFGLSIEDVTEVMYNDFHKPYIIYTPKNFYGATMIKLQYDNHDRLFKVIGYKNMNESPFARDIAMAIIKYNNRGNEIEVRNYGCGGRLIRALYEDNSITRYIYNDQNQITEEWCINEHGALREEFAIFKFGYDTSGNQYDLGWYNIEGKKNEEK